MDINNFSNYLTNNSTDFYNQFILIIITIGITILVSCFITLITSKSVEKSKLSYIIVKNNIDTVLELIDVIDEMKVMVSNDYKRYEDLTISIKLDDIDKTRVIRPYIIDDKIGCINYRWIEVFHVKISKISCFSSKEIVCFSHVMKEYLLSVNNISKLIMEEERWQFYYAICHDFRLLSNEMNKMLLKLLQKDIYKLKYKSIWDDKLVDKYRNFYIDNSNLFKYIKEFEKIMVSK